MQLKFAPVMPQADDPLVLHTSSVWQDRARFTFHYADGETAQSEFRSAHASRFLTIGAIFEFPVPLLMIAVRLRELSRQRDHALAGEQMARRLASTDPLTGLLNRRAFLELAIGRKSRQRLMLIDIDHFKSVNDRLGHANGDDVLRAVAETIQSCRPQRSLAVRLGGEEFALLIPRAYFAECSADMLLDAVRQLALPQGIKVTVSLGFADGSVDTEENWKRLYRLADAALYRAKSDGRNRACRATDFRVAA